MFIVETLAITGKWVPKDGEYRLHSMFSASVETFAAKLSGMRSRIVRRESSGKSSRDIVVECEPMVIGTATVQVDVMRWYHAAILWAAWFALMWIGSRNG